MEEVTCDLTVTAAPSEASLARIVGVLRRTRWSVEELHHRERCDHHEVDLTVRKPAGRPDLLVSLLAREVVVISVESKSDGRPLASLAEAGR
jgi:acetolactate synthase regulatory subunit